MMRAHLGISAALLLSACAANDPYQQTKTGAAIGAVAGAILGHQLDDDAGRYVGAAAGAALGGGIGYTLDRQQRELEALAAENQRLGMEVRRLEDDRLQVSIPSEVTFDFDSARIKPGFRPALDEMSDILGRDPSSRITIVGHTDSIGDASYNMGLSERRADSVASYLSSRGINPRRLYTEGRGELEPRADNGSEYGRRQNRRVEMYIESAPRTS